MEGDFDLGEHFVEWEKYWSTLKFDQRRVFHRRFAKYAKRGLLDLLEEVGGPVAEDAVVTSLVIAFQLEWLKRYRDSNRKVR